MGAVLFVLPLLGSITVGDVLALGGAILSMLLQPKPPQPTIKSMTSAWGNTWPLVYGTFRVAGQCLQAGDISKHSSKGKKGGPTYSQTFGMGFCEGPRFIGRIWADGQVIYDPRPITAPPAWQADTVYGVGDVVQPTGGGAWQFTASINGTTGGSEPTWNETVDNVTRDGTMVWVASRYKARKKIGQQFDFTMRQYNGTEDQPVDSALEEQIGVGKQPAYRGLVYIVFEDFNLSKFGNRIPNIEAEILPSPAVPFGFSPSELDSPFRQMWSDENGQIGYCWGGVDEDHPQILKIDLVNGALIKTGPVIDTDTLGIDPQFNPPVGYPGGQKLWIFGFNSNFSPGHELVVSFSTTTLDVVDVFDLGDWHAVNPADPAVPNGEGTMLASLMYNGTQQLLFLLNTESGLFNLYDLANVIYGGPSSTAAATLFYSPTFDKYDTLWFYDDHGKFWSFECFVGNVLAPGITLFSGTSYVGRADDGAEFGSISYNPDTDMAYAWSRVGGPSRDMYVVPINVVTKAVGTTMTATNAQLVAFNLGDVWGWHRPQRAAIYMGSGNPDRIGLFDYIAGTTTYYEPDFWASYPNIDGFLQFYSAAANFEGSGITAVNINASNTQPFDFWFFPLSVTATTLADICTDVSGRIGLIGPNYDYSGLESQAVRGAALLGRDTARSFLESMQPAYFFDLTDIGDQIVGSLRAQGTIVATIPEADLGTSKDVTSIVDRIASTRNDDLEIPQDLSIQYYDSEHDYQQGSQQARRSAITQFSTGRNTVSVPVVLNPGEAANAAQRGLYLTWVGRTVRKFNIPVEYLRLTPADVVKLQRDGRNYVVRITKSTLKPDWMIECEGVSEDLGTYVLQVPAPLASQTTGSFKPGTVNPVVPPLLAVMDTAVLRTDELSTPGVYVAAAPNVFDGGFDGVAAQESLDDSVWATVQTLPVAATFGITFDTPLPDWVNFGVWDHVNSFKVTLMAGALASATADELTQNLTNLCWLSNGEILQFAAAAFLGNDTDGNPTYRLSNLLRGRFGTEAFTGTHGADEQLVLLSVDTMNTANYAASDIGATRYWRGLNDSPENPLTAEQTLVMTTRRLLPFAPYFLRGSRAAGDLTITGLRRMRWRGTPLWSPPATDAPSVMQIDILNGLTVVRTLTSTLSANGSGITNATGFTAFYSSADQVLDFGSPQAAVSIVAYQVSAIAGRGYPGSKTV